jgi:catechol 2,3-dioxygenase-like lactoylglutathione lyase family enzyme
VGPVTGDGVLRSVDCVRLPVPDLDAALAFYRDRLGQPLLWRTATAAAVGLPGSPTELVLQAEGPDAEVDFLVDSLDEAVAQLVRSGASLQLEPFDIPVGRVARLVDPFGNELTVLELSRGRYVTDGDGTVTGVSPDG